MSRGRGYSEKRQHITAPRRRETSYQRLYSEWQARQSARANYAPGWSSSAVRCRTRPLSAAVASRDAGGTSLVEIVMRVPPSRMARTGSAQFGIKLASPRRPTPPTASISSQNSLRAVTALKRPG